MENKFKHDLLINFFTKYYLKFIILLNKKNILYISF